MYRVPITGFAKRVEAHDAVERAMDSLRGRYDCTVKPVGARIPSAMRNHRQRA